jgi:hypothetical protein
MPRPRKHELSLDDSPAALMTWAERIGEALGRGVARGINSSLNMSALSPEPRRRGRPPKIILGGPVPDERRCTEQGCPREARSKGLCSAHYQAERRRRLMGKQ